jgi:hypothetical protein
MLETNKENWKISKFVEIKNHVLKQSKSQKEGIRKIRK